MLVEDGDLSKFKAGVFKAKIDIMTEDD